MHYNKTEIERAGSVSIIDYCQHIGFDLVLKNHAFKHPGWNGLTINQNGEKFFDFSSSIGGGTIKFVRWIEPALGRSNISWSEAIQKLLDCDGGRDYSDVEYKRHDEPSMKPTRHTTFKPSKPFDNYRHVFAYLIKTRHLSQKIVQFFVKEKMLFEDNHHNCVFTCLDENGKSRGEILRSSQDFKIFKGMAPGSSYEYGFYLRSQGNEGLGGLEINNKNRLRVFESPIDLMSYFTLNEMSRPGYLSRTTENNLALAGLKPNTLLSHLRRYPEIDTVLLAVDNDAAGRKFKHEMCKKVDTTLKGEGRKITWIEQLPTRKDWNEDLQTKHSKDLVNENIESLL